MNKNFMYEMQVNIQSGLVGFVSEPDHYLSLKDIELIATIELLIENTEAMKCLVDQGFDVHCLIIFRNSIEILLRLSIHTFYYQTVNCEPAKRDSINISCRRSIKEFLKTQNKNEKLEIEAIRIIKSMFPNLYFSNKIEDIYKDLCGFSHPSNQLEDRFSKMFSNIKEHGKKTAELTVTLVGRSKQEHIPQDINNFLAFFHCNAMCVRFVLELFQNVIDNNDCQKIKTIMQEKIDDFHNYFANFRGSD